MLITKSFDINDLPQSVETDATLDIEITPIDSFDLTSAIDTFDFVSIDTTGLEIVEVDLAPVLSSSFSGSSVSVSASAAVGSDGQTFTTSEVSVEGNATADVSVVAISDFGTFDFG